jgi:hypothetical protein
MMSDFQVSRTAKGDSIDLDFKDGFFSFFGVI